MTGQHRGQAGGQCALVGRPPARGRSVSRTKEVAGRGASVHGGWGTGAEPYQGRRALAQHLLARCCAQAEGAHSTRFS